MALSKRRLVLRAALLVFMLLLIPYFFLMAAVTTKEFKAFAQNKASDFLGTDVKIGRIRIGVLGEIILSKFEVLSEEKNHSGLEIGQIRLRYSLPQILSGDYQVPSAIRIAAPRMTLGKNPLSLFQPNSAAAQGTKDPSHLELAGGEIRYRIPGLGAELFVNDIQASMVPRKGKSTKGSIKARLSGFLEGRLILKGEFNPDTGTRLFRGELREGSISNSFVASANRVTGKFLISNDVFTLTNFTLESGPQTAVLTGVIERMLTQPRADLKLQTTAPHGNAAFDVQADLEKETLKGVYQGPTEKISFRSAITYAKGRLQISKWLASDEAEGHAHLDFEKREAGVHYERDKKRFDVAVKYEDEQFSGAVRADHMTLQGLDFVTSATFVMKPADTRRLRFETTFQTDYFVLDTFALDDFKGSFTLDSGGLKYLRTSWGESFKASGAVKWGTPITTDLSIRIDRFDLTMLKRFADKPMPQEISGILSGGVKVKGAVIKPRITGSLNVKKGSLGKVDFETAVIQFSGFPPVLELKDSHVYRGRGSLLITGKVDFEAQNILRAVQFETQDHIVLYRGLDVTLTEDEGGLDMEIHPGVANVPAVGLKARGSDKKDEDVKDGNDRFFEVGPRFRF